MKNNYEMISKYIMSTTLGEKGTVRSFIKEIYEKMIKEDELIKEGEVSLRILNEKKDENGYIKVLKKKYSYHYFMYINIYSFLDSKESNSIKIFNMYVTILHEFEHIKLINEKQNLKYVQFVSVIETMKELKENYAFSLIKKIFTHGSRRDQIKRYQSLSSEIWCIHKSLERAYKDMKDFLSRDEDTMIYNMCKGIEIISRNLEIGYSPNGLPYNKFVDWLKTIDKFIRKDSSFLQKNIFVGLLFTNNGLKGIEEIYCEKKGDADELYDEIILRYFLYIEQDYNAIFNNNVKMKEYMENLLNEYCNRVTDYFQNRQLCNLFLDTEILEDNEKVLIKNVKRILICMKSYGMKNKVGGIVAE